VPAATFTGIFEGKWNLYVFGPKTVYSDRSYDAIGVYGHLGDLAGSQAVWPKLLPMVTAGMGKNDTAAFNLLIQGERTRVLHLLGLQLF
jgi:hypothetical protein